SRPAGGPPRDRGCGRGRATSAAGGPRRGGGLARPHGEVPRLRMGHGSPVRGGGCTDGLAAVPVPAAAAPPGCRDGAPRGTWRAQERGGRRGGGRDELGPAPAPRPPARPV